MDIQQMIGQLLESQGGALAEQLAAQIGIDPATAQQFVPAAIAKLGEALGGGAGGSGGGLDLGALVQSVLAPGNTDVSQLIGQVDVAGLAQQVGTSEPQARQGLETLAPKLLDSLNEQAGGGAEGLLSALGGGDAGGLLGAASKLGGLFNK